ncbi:helix-turn-helix domain-containing protein [Actinorugispora endophytica]|uniref:Helix-turn-helix protein n=1 Tax=Actinorugispora endophytica TaxID=1605990 RepID=A0A4R6UIN2_9ACTN|nr:helix-turn-helix transcriptional regulator [Actinorugispora endophytica]TDQ46322.1 helix-turn-helix protein [Actinorugispora endophytica]
MASSPTLRRRRLSRLLREAREQRGYTAKWVANEAKLRSGRPRGWSESKLTRLEVGDWKRLRTDDVNMLLDIYDIDAPEERAAYAALAKEANQKGWWASFGDALGSGQFVGLEAEASVIRTFESMTVPGLLQTEDYARAVIRGNGLVGDEADIDRRVQARMFRKQVFMRSDAPSYWAVIDEAALLRMTPELSGQLEHLLEVGSRPNVGIQVLPLSKGPHAAMTGQFVIMDFPLPDHPVVYLEVMSEEIYLEKPEEIRRYQHIYDYVQAEALSPDESRELIRNRLTSL